MKVKIVKISALPEKVKIVKASALPEYDIYYAVEIKTRYLDRRFESLTDCLDYCQRNPDHYPVTNNLEHIEQ